MSGWTRDKEWADKFIAIIEDLVRRVAHKIITFRMASDSEDKRYATDYVFAVEAGTVACRIRRGSCRYRDLTIRHSRPSGVETERHKIVKGFARFYLYIWLSLTGELLDWMFVDLDAVRENKLLDMDRAVIPNYDGTTFVSIGPKELFDNDALIDGSDGILREAHRL